MATDRDRQHLYAALETTLGEGPASTLMHLLPARGWDDVARHSDLAVVRGEMAELRGEMAELRAELKGEMAELRAEVRAFRAETRGEIAALRSKVDAQIPKFLVANVPIVFGTAGLVLAAARVI
ncbi:MAG TPA: hypothetical protein VF045_10300 [Acidimicrobiales bacterium]